MTQNNPNMDGLGAELDDALAGDTPAPVAAAAPLLPEDPHDTPIDVEEVDAEPVVETSTEVEAPQHVVMERTGETFSLAAGTDELCRVHLELVDFTKQVRDDVLGQINAELRRRMDHRATGTFRTEIRDGLQYELRVPSRTAGTDAYDSEKLYEELVAAVLGGELHEDAAERALRQTITVTFRVPMTITPAATEADPSPAAMRVDLDGLAERLKQTPRIADVPVEVLASTPGRSVDLRGVGALKKLETFDEALARARVEVPEPKRTVTIKPKTIEQAKATP